MDGKRVAVFNAPSRQLAEQAPTESLVIQDLRKRGLWREGAKVTVDKAEDFEHARWVDTYPEAVAKGYIEAEWDPRRIRMVWLR